MPAPNRYHALDHIVVVLFENRSLDNVLGHLYRPEDGKNFDGVIGKDLSNPIPEWAEHGADRKVVPYTVATDMDSPNPDRVRSITTPTPSSTTPSTSPTGSRSAKPWQRPGMRRH
jgi:phospholipase C